MNIIIRFFYDAVKKSPKYFLKALSFTLIYSLLQAVIPWILQICLDSSSNILNFISISKILLIIFILLLMSIFFEIKWIISLDQFGGTYINNLLTSCEKKLSQADLYTITKLGKQFINHTLYANILDVFRVIGHHFPQLIGALFIVLPSLIISIYFNRFIALFLIFSFVFGVIISYFSRKHIFNLSSLTNEKLKIIHSLINEYSNEISFIKSNNLSAYYINKTEIYMHDFIDTSTKEDTAVYFYSGIIKQFNRLLQVIFSILLSVVANQNNIVNIVIFTMVFSLIMEQGGKVELLLQQINRSIIYFKNIESVLQLSPSNGSHIINSIDSLSLKLNSFSYPNSSSTILNNLSFELKRGDCLILNGGNGSGKSTILNLITKLYETYDGIIKINDINLKDISTSSYIKNVLFLSQEEPLLNENIYDYLRNITHTTITNQDIDQILLNLKFGNIPNKIENNGSNLSEGQKKKLLLAKLLIGHNTSSLIILDEVDSSLDVDTKDLYEKIVNELHISRNHIIVVIQHNRSSTIKYTKKINL